MAVDPLIELRDVSKYYGEPHVLQEIKLTVGKGEVAVVTGPSGSGKPTLCRTINRLKTVCSASITLDGVSQARAAVRGRRKQQADKRSRELLDRVGLAHQAGNHPPQLCAGRQQRVAVARSLAIEPKALLHTAKAVAGDLDYDVPFIPVMMVISQGTPLPGGGPPRPRTGPGG